MLKYEPSFAVPAAHDHQITCIAITADCSQIVSGSTDCALVVSSLHDGRRLWRFVIHSPPLALAWANDRLLCGTNDGSILSVYFSNRNIKVHGFVGHAMPIEVLAVQDCHGLMASGAGNETKLWRWQFEEKCISGPTLPNPPPSESSGDRSPLVTSINWLSTVSETALLVGYVFHGIVCWDRGEHGFEAKWTLSTPIWFVPHLVRFETLVMTANSASAAISADHRWLAICDLHDGFRLHEIPINNEYFQLFTPQSETRIANPALFVHDGLALVGSDSFGSVRIWSTESGERLQVLRHENRIVRAIAAGYNQTNDTFTIATGVNNEASAASQTGYVQVWKTVHINHDGPFSSPYEHVGGPRLSNLA